VKRIVLCVVLAATQTAWAGQLRSDADIRRILTERIKGFEKSVSIVVFTKENKKTRGGWQGERAQAIRAVSRAIWRYYHPNEKWSPPAGVEKY
jgi:hypothetical protein